MIALVDYCLEWDASLERSDHLSGKKENNKEKEDIASCL
jgi:hypothetical protein